MFFDALILGFEYSKSLPTIFMLASEFDFFLPPELIAQTPAEPRDSARLLHFKRENGALSHRVFSDLPSLLRADDLLVFNDTRVLRARLRGHKIGENGAAGGRVEALLLREIRRNVWEVLLKPSARLRAKTPLIFASNDEKTAVRATPIERREESWLLQFLPENDADIRDFLPQLGEVPLPPYITARDSTEADYQTVYARQTKRSNAESSTRSVENAAFDAFSNAVPEEFSAENSALESAAAPTAGLHFTPQLLEKLREIGVRICFVTLAIGIGTFRPMKSENLDEHVMHREEFGVSAETARQINEQKARGGRVVAVGTTTVRVLEAAAQHFQSDKKHRNSAPSLQETTQETAHETAAHGETFKDKTDKKATTEIVRAGYGDTEIFIRPGYEFRAVDALITNFHLPKSTLLVMISAFAQTSAQTSETAAQNKETPSGLTKIRAAYDEAIRENYRFFSFGDAMFLE